MKIMNGAALREHEVDPFRTIEGAAAAKPDDRVDSAIRRVTPARLEHPGVGIRAELAEMQGVDTGRLERSTRVIVMTGPHQAGVRHDERAPESELFRQRPELIDRSVPEKHTDICLEFQP